MLRLDQLLVTQGLARSRTRAQRLIRNGRVRMGDGGKVLAKPGEKLPHDTPLHVAEDPEERYVSRAGLKLEALLESLNMRLDGKVVLDVGQSTGGFTDCALRFGARHVIGVEVGHAQLDPELRGDVRITCLEGLNARNMANDPRLLDAIAHHAPVGLDLVIMDVSFISQTLILPALRELMPMGGQLLSLVKPQFEVGPGKVNARGIVDDLALLEDVKAKLQHHCSIQGFDILSWGESPILGGDGNRELLLHARRAATTAGDE